MKEINISALNSEIKSFVSERDWDQFHSLKNLACALSVECSELLEIFQWMNTEDSKLILEDQSKKTKLEDEVADVFVYLMRIVDKADIDLELVVRSKLKKNAEKYPVELSKGNSKKYSEL